MLRRGLPGWTGQSLKQGGRVVGHHTEAFVGIDTSKLRNAIAIADGGRGGEVRFLGEFLSTEAAIRKLVAKLAAKHCHLTFSVFASWNASRPEKQPPGLAPPPQRRRIDGGRQPILQRLSRDHLAARGE